ncbi:MAG: hypothetical protein CO162_00415 [bacterium (Candidatus Ratteibacteria) CG_4_9_14_3_um_filter_41_21]|uniref:Uroporphyrinogen decarboxylase (URO-D) domain-containing protein n=3 Tax=Candidatus Ratteibacteria TaxID=2979319 RepID=A0A2M7E6N4_9BACT|nr:MAG: hypothetical protein COS11_07625 [bacterium (Candidatus Ratteibacteria) CG01_land_8_20_14_3_00_40_19]PJA62554.1 MAG: hypothetical protein CO162_00415 [bacterium (Candidatus Ratteibacteria) CG_4_9_14_3_um_filter_41_21]HCG76910.1 hypothetical protein [bacterium]
MKTLAYKQNTQDVLNRLRSLYEERDQDKIFAGMHIPNKHLEEFKNNNIAGNCDYPDPSERILFWDSVLHERINLLDDSIPSVYLSEMDQGIYGGILGGDIKFTRDTATAGLTAGWVSSMVTPLLNDLAELDKLKFDKSHKWYKRYINQLKIFVKGASNKFGISHFILIDGLNSIFELIGATKTYLSLIDKPELVQKAIDFAHNLNAEVQTDFFDQIPLLGNGTCSNLAEWIPGRIVSESVDPFHMTSVEYFEQWGREPVERIFNKFDGGILHLHGNGRHLLKAVSTIKGLKAIRFCDDKDSPPAFNVLNKIKIVTGFIPLIVDVECNDFYTALERHNLIGGILYEVDKVADIDFANRLMDKVREYQV